MSNIEEFDKLEISELLKKPSKALLVCIYVKIKQQNGIISQHTYKLKWHDKILLGIFGSIFLAVVAAIIVGVIRGGI